MLLYRRDRNNRRQSSWAPYCYSSDEFESNDRFLVFRHFFFLVPCTYSRSSPLVLDTRFDAVKDELVQDHATDPTLYRCALHRYPNMLCWFRNKTDILQIFASSFLFLSVYETLDHTVKSAWLIQASYTDVHTHSHPGSFLIVFRHSGRWSMDATPKRAGTELVPQWRMEIVSLFV